MTDDTPAPVPAPTAGTGAGTGAGTVSLRRFAAAVPMPYSTARAWRTAGRITARATVTGRYVVPLDQLADVRAALGLDPRPRTEGTT